MGFVSYFKKRILGKDPRFREDRTYVMFLALVKESLELKRSRVTFFRKARKHYKGKSEFLKEAGRDEIERTDLGYKAFKLIRGTAPYLQDKRNSVMAMTTGNKQ